MICAYSRVQRNQETNRGLQRDDQVCLPCWRIRGFSLAFHVSRISDPVSIMTNIPYRQLQERLASLNVVISRPDTQT